MTGHYRIPENYQWSSMNVVKLQDTKLIHRNPLHLYINNERSETFPPKAICRLNAIPIINSIFHRTRTKSSKIYIETQNTPNTLRNLEKEKWSRRKSDSLIRLHYKATISVEQYWYQSKYTSTEQARKARNKSTQIR